MTFETISGEKIDQAWIGIPSGHKHIRVFLRCGERIFVFNEAVFSNLIRGFLSVLTHPTLSAVKLKTRKITDAKPGFDPFQLLESSLSAVETQKELDGLFQLWIEDSKSPGKKAE